MLCSIKWKLLNKSTKGEHLLKHPLGQIPTVIVMSGGVREDNPPRLPTPRKVALETARQTIQATQEMCQPVLKRHACFMPPDTTQSSVKQLRFIQTSMPHSGHIKIKKPNLAANLSMLNPPSLEITKRRSASWKPMMILSLRRKRGKTKESQN